MFSETILDVDEPGLGRTGGKPGSLSAREAIMSQRQDEFLGADE
jgi:hypothetical protein